MPAHAFILAAGRGERMRPLSDHTPKPLLAVRGRPLIEWHLEALARAGIDEVVINTAWLEEQFVPALGDGSRFGLRLHWSNEGAAFGGALETAGGIAHALPRLGPWFWVVAGDVFLPGFDFSPRASAAFAAGTDLARLWLAPNPPHHRQGDFALDGHGRLHADGPQRLTWASVGLFRAELFAGLEPGRPLKLRVLFDAALAHGRLGGQRLEGEWVDVGTPERLAALNVHQDAGAR